MASLFPNPDRSPIQASISLEGIFISPPVWKITSGNPVIQVSADGLSCVIMPDDKSARISVSATVDLGDGEGPVLINDSVSIGVVQPPFPNLGLVFASASVNPDPKSVNLPI